MALEYKGQLAYKDPSGNVWNIGIDEFDMWFALNAEGKRIANEFIDELLQAIDDGPEWIKIPPSPGIQMEQLDRGAFPNAGD